MKNARKSIIDIKSQKGKEPIAALTSYSYNMARIADEFVDILLVGDSLGMVVYGMESTLGVTIDMMINHGKAVVKGSQNALVVIDMPFGSYQKSPEQAFENAARIIVETSAQAVKIEGGVEMAETIRFLTERGIPVLGHVALKPQYFNSYGGYKYQGRTENERNSIMNDAIAVDNAGAFAMVIEGSEKSLAEEITARVSVPTIGIGASEKCDGQVLVLHDILGIGNYVAPKFAKQYADIESEVKKAVQTYVKEVKTREFPELKHCFIKK
jgi:3-methyl-2-oxobutanoate hydroxymethyltransferase